ncbi:hypothetical protein POM88_027012 [Heracleum sosnowskyi]|uniref:AP180 N-terminal homology (ANTH) domain-containing protein n=1 Tax=Heracleum sosnowskyi TaxID=360622 RepID=A0AAD8MQL4_9APIA|nr:hypothetical protein POM88_027012 [Heracleum sosnowskyi]
MGFQLRDSSVDSGTNNFLGTLARADRLPYGRDFDTHRPTGRFSNGKIPVDFLALRLGLPYIPTYLGQTAFVEDMIHGVNYASVGAGLIFTSGSELGQHISFTQQVQQVTDTFQQLILNMGEDVAAHLISNSLFYISIGTNDYIHYYLRNQLLFRVLGCQPQGAAVHNFVIQLALSMVASESIKIYNAITDGTVNLVDKFFEMNRQDALKALEIYKRPDLNFQLFVDSVLCLCCQIELISRLHHFHVVPLLGFCSENQGKRVERLLSCLINYQLGKLLNMLYLFG